MGETWRRFFWSKPWYDRTRPLVFVLALVTLGSLVEGLVYLIIVIFWLSLTLGLLGSLLWGAGTNKSDHPQFWALTADQRLEVVDAVQRGESPDDPELAVAVLEVTGPLTGVLKSHQLARRRAPVRIDLLVVVCLVILVGFGITRFLAGDLVWAGVTVLMVTVLAVLAPGEHRRLERRNKLDLQAAAAARAVRYPD
jgi:hypothetical protein